MATMLPTPATTRMPFGEINGPRLQSLTSMKNRQNAITSLSSPTKRKAQAFDIDTDAENIDPSFFSPKRSKADSTKPSTHLFVTPSSTRTILTPRLSTASSSRTILTPKLNTSTSAGISKTLSAPAGRSPTSKKRSGILNRRRTVQRIDPPAFTLSSSTCTPVAPAPFSLSAALAGTIPSYTPRSASSLRNSQALFPSVPTNTSLSSTSTSSSGWEFTIHEDTPEEEAQILMLHGACILDISSDEESKKAKCDARGKENLPPVDDVSQFPSSSSVRDRRFARDVELDADRCDVDRYPLGDLNAADFVAEGVDKDEVVLVCDDEVVQVEKGEQVSSEKYDHQENDTVGADNEAPAAVVDTTTDDTVATFEFSVDVPVKGKGRAMEEVEALVMAGVHGCGGVSSKAALLEPVEKAEEGWSVWESGSAKGDE